MTTLLLITVAFLIGFFIGRKTNKPAKASIGGTGGGEQDPSSSDPDSISNRP